MLKRNSRFGIVLLMLAYQASYGVDAVVSLCQVKPQKPLSADWENMDEKGNQLIFERPMVGHLYEVTVKLMSGKTIFKGNGLAQHIVELIKNQSVLDSKQVYDVNLSTANVIIFKIDGHAMWENRNQSAGVINLSLNNIPSDAYLNISITNLTQPNYGTSEEKRTSPRTSKQGTLRRGSKVLLRAFKPPETDGRIKKRLCGVGEKEISSSDPYILFKEEAFLLLRQQIALFQNLQIIKDDIEENAKRPVSSSTFQKELDASREKLNRTALIFNEKCNARADLIVRMKDARRQLSSDQLSQLIKSIQLIETQEAVFKTFLTKWTLQVGEVLSSFDEPVSAS